MVTYVTFILEFCHQIGMCAREGKSLEVHQVRVCMCVLVVLWICWTFIFTPVGSGAVISVSIVREKERCVLCNAIRTHNRGTQMQRQALSPHCTSCAGISYGTIKAHLNFLCGSASPLSVPCLYSTGLCVCFVLMRAP